MSQIADLLEDLEFIRWVRNPDSELHTYWNTWMEANPGRIADVRLAREVVLGLKFPAQKPSVETKQQILKKLLHEIGPSGSSTSRNHRPQRFLQGTYVHFAKVAAVLLGVVALSLLLFRLHEQSALPTEASATRWTSKSTNPGEKLTFRLPDQTTVWLNSGSSLEFPESFDSTVRLVKLKGEGFFEIKENAAQPFQVLADGLLTTALGTSFNVNAKYQDSLKVSLLTGKVVIRHESDSSAYFLVPGEELKFQKSQMEGVVGTFDTDQVMGWRFGRLVFHQATLARVIEDLEAWYGVELSIAGNPRSEWSLNGAFENQSLENVLRSISNIEGFSYKIEGKKVKIQF